MKIRYIKYPADIVLCIVWSTILVPIIILNNEGILRIILSIPFIFFIPGYLIQSALFPIRKKVKRIEFIDRITMSFGLSIAVVSLIGFILNYTPWGIRLEFLLITIFAFIVSVGSIALLKWFKTEHHMSFVLSFNWSKWKSENWIDKILTIAVVISVISVGVFSVYVIQNPQRGEPLTEFYLFSSTGEAKGYSTNLTMGLNSSVILEIDNHEYKTINYTIDIWLVNESANLNRSENTSKTIIHNMWFLHKHTIVLEHTDIDVQKQTMHQWEYNYSFTINKTGSFKLAFLLNTTPTDNYTINTDIKSQKNISSYSEFIKSSYRELHLWIDVYDRRPIANFTYVPGTATIGETINFTDNTKSLYSNIVWLKWDFGDGNMSNGEITGLRFNGIDDYIDVGNNSSLQPVNGTIEAWIFITEYWGVRIIFVGSSLDIRRHPNFYIGNNKLALGLYDNRNVEYHILNTTFLMKKTWYHVAATWDGKEVSFYLNGSLMQTDNQNITPANNTDTKLIGTLYTMYRGTAFSGNLKDLKIYHRALNDTEIQNNYQGNVTTDGLVSWWKMNDGGAIAYDSIGTNDGTIYGADWINQAAHTFSHPGSYQVQLTVSNEYGQINSISKTITVI